MRFLVIISLLVVTLLARNRKHYLIEVEDKNETNDEKKMIHNDDENVENQTEEKNDAEGKSVEPRKVSINNS